MQGDKLHESLQPIAFLMGKWKSTKANGSYPTIEPFNYCEDLEFTSAGQPLLNYTSKTWHPTKGNAMHLESGFLRIKPGTHELAFLVAHNFGLTSLEEGNVEGNQITLKSVEISRMSFAKEPRVTCIERTFQYEEESNMLHVSVRMETTKTPLSDHLSVTYKRI